MRFNEVAWLTISEMVSASPCELRSVGVYDAKNRCSAILHTSKLSVGQALS